MQTSIHTAGFELFRMPNFAWQSSTVQRYIASGETLDALRARTTPIDTTNPYTTSHASCANAFLATAITVGARYSEMNHQLPTAAVYFKGSVQPAALVAVTDLETAPLPAMNVAQQIEPIELQPLSELQLVTEVDIAPALPLEFVPMAAEFQQPASLETVAMPQQADNTAKSIPAPASTSASQEVINAEFQVEEDGVSFSGNAPANTLVEFYIDDVLVGSAESDTEGFWQFMPPTALPPAEHHFSAVVKDDFGAIRCKTDLFFSTKIPHDEILAPIADSVDDQIDIALIELALLEDELPVEFAAADFNHQLLDGWLMPVNTNAGAPQLHVAMLSLDELETSDIIWH